MDTMIAVKIVLIVGPIIALAIFLIGYFIKNNKDVGPTEWLVMKNTLSGEVTAYRPGIHFFGPEMQEFVRIPTTIQEETEKGETVGVIGGIEMKLDYRINYVTGRVTKKIRDRNDPSSETNMDDFANPNGEPLENATITDEMMQRAATKLDPAPEKKKQQIAQGLDYAFEQVFRALTDDQLQHPQTHAITLPTQDVGWLPAPKLVTDPREMLNLLGEEIRIRANNGKLFGIGVGLTSVYISNIMHASASLQEARTRSRKLELEADAIKKAMAKLPDGGKHLAPTVQALFGEPTAMAEAAKAEALKKLAKALPAIKDLIHIENH